MDLVGVRTMEFCRRWGIVDWVRDAPYPGDYPQDCVWVTDLNGFELGREQFPGRAFEARPPQSPQKRERVPQDMFDPILRRFATSFDCVDLQYQTALVVVRGGPDRVEATLRDTSTGATRTVTADYLIGTDGGASTVREGAGIPMSGNPALTYTTNVLFRCADFPSLHRMGKAYRFIFIGPEGTWLTIVAVNGGDRFRMSIVGTPDKVNHSEADIRAALRRAMGKDFDYEILSVMRWVRRELVADRYGAGRVFIAGDAAHLMSPTGALGMNTGIQDAVDLGWKLEAVLRGWGGADLLRSYESERRPVALRNVAASTENLGRMLSTRERKPPPEVFETGPQADAIRREYGDWFTADHAARMVHERLSSRLPLRRFADRVAGRHAGAAARDPHLYPDARGRARARRMCCCPTGARPSICSGAALCCCVSAPMRRAGRACCGRRRTPAFPCGPCRSICRRSAQAYQRALVLVRPDGHVAWRADAEPLRGGRRHRRGAGRASRSPRPFAA